MHFCHDLCLRKIPVCGTSPVYPARSVLACWALTIVRLYWGHTKVTVELLLHHAYDGVEDSHPITVLPVQQLAYQVMYGLPDLLQVPDRVVGIGVAGHMPERARREVGEYTYSPQDALKVVEHAYTAIYTLDGLTDAERTAVGAASDKLQFAVRLSRRDPGGVAIGCHDPSLNAPFSLHEIIDTVQALKDVSAGLDCLHRDVLQALSHTSLQLLLDFYNTCFTRGYWPEFFRTLEIILLHKGGGEACDEVLKYRPIAIIAILAKLPMIMMLRCLEPSLEEHGAYSDSQFGGRKHAGPQLASVLLFETVAVRQAAGVPTYGAKLDVAKAFDTHVIHQLMVLGLFEAGVRGRMFPAIAALDQLREQADTDEAAAQQHTLALLGASTLCPSLAQAGVGAQPLRQLLMRGSMATLHAILPFGGTAYWVVAHSPW